MKKIVPITTDDSNAFRLDDRPPAAPVVVGETRSITSRLQAGAMIVVRLVISPSGHVTTLDQSASTPRRLNGADLSNTASRWRIEASVDGIPVRFGEGGRVMGELVGRDLLVRFTNTGEEPAHFYAHWELEDAPASDAGAKP